MMGQIVTTIKMIRYDTEEWNIHVYKSDSTQYICILSSRFELCQLPKHAV